MLSLEQIKTRIQKIEPALWPDLVSLPEVQMIPHVLLKGETLEAVTRGSHQKSSGLILATNHRILYIDSTSWTPFPFASLTSINYRSSIEFADGSLLGSLSLQISGKLIVLNKVPANGHDFSKRARSILEKYSPDPHYSSEKQAEEPLKGKSNRTLFFLGSALLACLVAAFLFTSQEDANSLPALAVKVDDFSKHWNEAGKELGSPYQIEELKVVKNGNERSFSHYLTEDLKVMGTLASNGDLSKLILLGYAEQSLPLLTEQSITAIQPEMAPPERQELLKELGLSGGKPDMEDRQISQSGIRYSITYTDKLGIVFEAAPISP